MKTAVRVFGLSLLTILLISCPLIERDYGSPSSGLKDNELPDDELGTIEIIFGAGSSATKTLIPPPEELNITRYEIEGTLEGGGDSFIASVDAGDSFTQSGLTPGSWTISVDAINAEEIAIGYGDTAVEIVAGESSTVHIIISPLGGLGTLDLTIQWKKQLFTSGEIIDIVATVTPDIGGSPSLVFGSIVEEGAYRFRNCLQTGVPAGYYLVTMQLIVDEQQVWGIAEAVIIFEDATTSHIYTYTQK